jgi:hypothetical protein
MPQEITPDVPRISSVSTSVPGREITEIESGSAHDGTHGNNLDLHDGRVHSLTRNDTHSNGRTDASTGEQDTSHSSAKAEQDTRVVEEKQSISSLTGFKHIGWAQKLGKTAITVLFLGDIVILLCLGLRGFLWFSDTRNSTWRAVVVRDWMTQAITIISEALKLAVGFQIGTCSAMLASLALERFEVELENAAPVALLRASVLGSGAILGLSQEQGWLWRMLRKWKSALPLLIIAFLLVFAFLQAITIVLVSDLGLIQLPARTFKQPTQYGPNYQSVNFTNVPQTGLIDRTTTWLRKPQEYPTFAEHREDAFVEDGVDDTGMTLRAFLPFQASSKRENINDYVGKTTVLDNRVTCQRPSVDHAVVQYVNQLITLNGTIASTRNTPRMDNATARITSNAGIAGYSYNVPVPFACVVPTTGALKNLNEVTGKYRIAICQLGEGDGTSAASGGLVSEFLDPANLTAINQNTYLPPSQQRGTAYILLNVTLGDSSHWQAVTERGAHPPAISAHGAWQDLVYSDADLVLSVSLCYAAFNTAEIPVRISSIANRTEPLPSYDSSKQLYHFDDIREQLGQNRSRSSLERGVLDLSPVRSSWLAHSDELPTLEPWIRSFANMNGPSDPNSGNNPNLTAILWQAGICQTTSAQTYKYPNPTNWICPDPMHVFLFQEILQSGGSAAFALQALITSLSNIAYYDQLAQFDKSETVAQTYFLTSNAAVRHNGFAAVAAVMAFHVLMVIICLWIFLAGTRWSILGNTWCAVAQLVGMQTIDFWEKAANGATDGSVRKLLKAEGRDRVLVGVSEGAHGVVSLEEK